MPKILPTSAVTVLTIASLAAAASPSFFQSPIWEAQIRPNGTSTFVGGRATMGGTSSGDSTAIAIMVTGVDTATPIPWQVHERECGAKTGPSLAPISKFPPIQAARASADPSAVVSGSASVVLAMKVPAEGKYSVSVFASPKDTVTPIACGDFAVVPPEMEE